MLGQVIVNDQHVFALVHEIFRHGYAGVRSQVLQRSGLCGRSGHDDGVVLGTVFFKGTGQACNRGGLLADGYINAENAVPFLVDDRIDDDGGFTGATVADDQFTLTTSDRYHGVDSLDTGLQRYIYRFTVCNARRRGFDRTGSGIFDFTQAIDGFAQGVDDTAQQAFAYRNLHQFARAAYDIALADGGFTAHQHDADAVRHQVLHHAVDAAFQGDQFACHSMAEAGHGRNAVAYFFNGADFFHIGLDVGLFNSLCQAFGHCGEVRQGTALYSFLGHGIADLFHLTFHAGVINLIAGF